MATHLIQTIQEALGYAPLHKIDPNSQETKEKWHQTVAENLAQAALPAVLTAVFKFTRNHDNCERLLQSGTTEDWLHILYDGREKQAVDKVAGYAGASAEETERHMENIADEAISEIKKRLGENPTPDKVKDLMNGERHDILAHLPAALQLGSVLRDETLDDRTNKMEGPVSNIMHKIGNTLSGSDE
ncbi:hypothetical protein JMG10_20615 [Nostoc ellipsosporum NOK]|jgi:hypothetical protein|nr:hypothetical protein [Nostoc ellipsosporum NOK]